LIIEFADGFLDRSPDDCSVAFSILAVEREIDASGAFNESDEYAVARVIVKRSLNQSAGILLFYCAINYRNYFASVPHL